MRKYLSRFALVSFLILALSVLVYIVCVASTPAADLVNGTVSVAARFILSSITYLLPFSLFELLIILSPAIILLAVLFLVKRGTDRPRRIRAILSVLGVISIIFTSYIYTLGVGYHSTGLAERIGVEDKADLSAEELYCTAVTVVDEINLLAEKIELRDGETHMPYSLDGMSERLIDAYDSVNERYSLLVNYPSRVKSVYFSSVMSDLGISGIYSFFTGEANVNVEYPDYCTVYSAAHELAHQRGICRENEANFVAFLVCISSSDEYIRYCGYLNMYEYLANALYRLDPELYREVRSRLSAVAVSDMKAAGAVYDLHKDSPLGKINERLNDAYLKANGTEGVVSYGYVVRLAVGYYQKNKG